MKEWKNGDGSDTSDG